MHKTIEVCQNVNNSSNQTGEIHQTDYKQLYVNIGSVIHKAVELDMTAQELHKFLYKEGVIYKQGEQWFLYARFQKKGFARTREATYKKKDGRIGLALTTVWTQVGRMFIRRLVNFRDSLTRPAE